MDRPEITSYLDDKGWNIHAKGKQLTQDIGIMGVGYSTPTPFMTPSEVPDTRLAQWLTQGYEQIKHLPKLILVAHDPPLDQKQPICLPEKTWAIDPCWNLSGVSAGYLSNGPYS